MRKKEDRRVKYTKALLKDALLELMQENHISKVSVTALCELADVHRSTFYAHYADQYDLLRQLQKEVLTNILRYMEKQGVNDALPVTERKLVSILEYGKKNSRLIIALLGDSSDDTFQNDIMQLVNLIVFKNDTKTDEHSREYIALFGVHGCIAIIQKWLQNGMPESTTEIAKLIMQLTQYGSSMFV